MDHMSTGCIVWTSDLTFCQELRLIYLLSEAFYSSHSIVCARCIFNLIEFVICYIPSICSAHHFEHLQLGRRLFTHLKVYKGTEHPHVAQKPVPLPIRDKRIQKTD